MTKRYFIPSPPTAGRASLDGPEAHHLLHVMRAEVGDQVTLFDGDGGQFTACVVELFRDRVELETGPRETVDRESSMELALGVAMPKGERQKWLVEKLTELGVSTLVPLVTERGVVDLRGRSHEKLKRTVIEASKQCGRNRLMKITKPLSLAEFLDQATGLRLLADPSGKTLNEFDFEPTEKISAAIGPEGGWTDKELAAAKEHDWKIVNLGPSILRVETAAVAVVAWSSFAPRKNDLLQSKRRLSKD